jgi:hypothetical protein
VPRPQRIARHGHFKCRAPSIEWAGCEAGGRSGQTAGAELGATDRDASPRIGENPGDAGTLAESPEDVA